MVDCIARGGEKMKALRWWGAGLVGLAVLTALYVTYRATVSERVVEFAGTAVAPPGPPTPWQEPMMSKAGVPTLGEVASAPGSAPEGDVVWAKLASSQPPRYLIRTASLTLEVGEIPQALEKLTQTAKDYGGYLSDLQEWTDELGNQSATVTFRVPASRFDEALRTVRALGKTLSVQVTSEDVTEEYVDVEAQLRNLKRTEERLLGHLSRTGRLADTLAVERELSRVRQEIERLEGRMRFLSHRVAYCSLMVMLRQRARAQPLVPPETFSTARVASDAVRSLVAFARSLWTVLVWLAVWAAVWVPLGAFGWVGYRRWRRS